MLEASEIAPGEKVDCEATAGTLVNALVDEPMTLKELLANGLKKSFRIHKEGHVWTDSKPSGREI